MRALFFLLLFANLAFLAWSQWIDVPQLAPANDAYAKLPRLKLVGELPAGDSRPSSGSARKTALQAPAPTPASQCLSIGPFDDQPGATRGASLLRERGLTPRQRAEQGEVSKGFWVYIGGLKSNRDVSQVLRTLEQSHVEDAHVMPDTGDDAHQVSVGLFSERERAERRAQAVQKLGLRPEIAERKVSGTVFWMDVDLPPGAATPTVQDVAGEGATFHVAVVPCPDNASGPGATPIPPAPGATTTTIPTKVAGASQVP